MSLQQYDFAGELSSLPRSHKFLLKLGNLIQVKTIKNCSSTSIASALSTAAIEDGISVNSLDDSLKRFNTSSGQKRATNLNYRSPHLSPHLNAKNSTNCDKVAHEIKSGDLDYSFPNQNSLFNFSRRPSLNSNQYFGLIDPPPLSGGSPFLLTNFMESSESKSNPEQSLFNFQYYHNLKIPPNIAESASNEILDASKNEPYGLRGCVVRVRLLLLGGNDGKTSYILGHVICDPDTITTFQMELILREDEQKVLTKLKYLLPKRLAKHAPIIVSPKYSLKKKRLFRIENDTTSAEE